MNQIPTGLNIGNAFGRVIHTGRNLWLAGVGAVAEVGEGGLEMFDRLVERGRPVEARQRRRVEAVAGRAARAVRTAGQRVQETVESESRGVLRRLSVMTHEDVTLLSARIQTLSKKVDEVVVARRQAAAPATVIKIVSPEGETAAVVIAENPGIPEILETSTAAGT